MEPGNSRQFIAEARDAKGSPIPGVEFRWSSTQQTVATVSSNGVVSANSTGSSTIRATLSGQTGQASVSVGSSESAGNPWRPNEPSGWVSQIHSGFDYSGIQGGSEDWFRIPGSDWSGRYAPYPGSIHLETGLSGPALAPDGVRFSFPGGLRDGQRSARITNNAVSGNRAIYFTYTFRLSENWSQRATPETLPFKHIEVVTQQADGSAGRMLMTGFLRRQDSSSGGYMVRIGNNIRSEYPNTVAYANRSAGMPPFSVPRSMRV